MHITVFMFFDRIILLIPACVSSNLFRLGTLLRSCREDKYTTNSLNDFFQPLRFHDTHWSDTLQASLLSLI